MQKLGPAERARIKEWLRNRKSKGELCKELNITYKTLGKYIERIQAEEARGAA